MCIWIVRVKAGQSSYLNLYQATVVMCLITFIIIQVINVTVVTLQSCESQSTEEQGSVKTRQEQKNKQKKNSPSSSVSFYLKAEQHWMRRKCVRRTHTNQAHYADKQYDHNNMKIMAPTRRKKQSQSMISKTKSHQRELKTGCNELRNNKRSFTLQPCEIGKADEEVALSLQYSLLLHFGCLFPLLSVWSNNSHELTTKHSPRYCYGCPILYSAATPVGQSPSSAEVASFVNILINTYSLLSSLLSVKIEYVLSNIKSSQTQYIKVNL